ncbi:MAG: biotin synthase BioB [Desulfuromonadales bacterium C00003096]|jgi:biotin synthase|nr:MAG: biotin synthase BioB [Desulfuromonadales bacterium C00003096]
MQKRIRIWTERLLAGGVLSGDEGLALLEAKGPDLGYLLAGAQQIREHFKGDRIALCSIINAKSGRCSENCAFCAQSVHHSAEPPVYDLKSLDEIVAGAHGAAEQGCHCYGIVSSGSRLQPGPEMERLLEAIRQIRATTRVRPSASLGLLDRAAAAALAAAGCAVYHHNLETACSFFPSICTTHEYEQDVETVRVAKQAGMSVCCGGLFGLGESLAQRVELALALRELQVDSVPINFLAPVAGTPLAGQRQLSPLDCLRIIALYRYMLPECQISVCGGRELNLGEFQSWIFMAGASGMMVGNYLTMRGRDLQTDLQMIKDAGLSYGSCN